MSILNNACRRGLRSIVLGIPLPLSGDVPNAVNVSKSQIHFRFRSRSSLASTVKTTSRTRPRPLASAEAQPEADTDDGGQGHGKQERINLEEIRQRVSRRSNKDFVFPDSQPEGETEREYRLNSHFYRRLFPWKSKEELATYLCQQIVHQSDGLIAINKPFGIGTRKIHEAKEDVQEMLRRSGKEVPKMAAESDPLHHARGTGVCEYTLEDILPNLRTKLGEPRLTVVKAVEKFCSGIVIFSTNDKAAERIQRSMKLNKPLGIKTYSFYVISTNISKKFLDVGTLKERVAITLAENPETKVAHPIILRDFSKKKARDEHSDIKPVSVELTLLDKNSILNVCLSRLDTNSTRNNFLRVYYANIVSPVLGDHLYGSRVAQVGGVMVPVPPAMARIGVGHQVLTKEVISALSLRRLEDSIVIPLHAHLQTITLGNFYGKGDHLHISAEPFSIFSWACRRLSLKLPTPPEQDNDLV